MPAAFCAGQLLKVTPPFPPWPLWSPSGLVPSCAPCPTSRPSGPDFLSSRCSLVDFQQPAFLLKLQVD